MGLKAQGTQIYADVFHSHLYIHELPPGLFQWQKEAHFSHMRDNCVMRHRMPRRIMMILHAYAGACMKPASVCSCYSWGPAVQALTAVAS